LLKDDCCELVTAWKGKHLLAGVILGMNNYPFYWIGSSSRQHAKCNASSYLHWKIILDSKKRGYDIYDLGGASFESKLLWAYVKIERHLLLRTSVFLITFGFTIVTIVNQQFRNSATIYGLPQIISMFLSGAMIMLPGPNSTRPTRS